VDLVEVHDRDCILGHCACGLSATRGSRADGGIGPTKKHSRKHAERDRGVACGPGGPPYKRSMCATNIAIDNIAAVGIVEVWRPIRRL
jgi:hypothetical protein